MKKSALFCALIIAINFMVIVYPINTIAAETTGKKDMNIEVVPGDSIFNIENMKPGDWAPRTVTIKNIGNKDFKYQVTVENKGAEKLFNELTFEIRDHQQELYNGKLADFTHLTPRKLAAGTEEDLNMTIRFPEHLGNDFQGLHTHITLLFSTKEIKGDGGNDGEPGDNGDNGDNDNDDGEDPGDKEDNENPDDDGDDPGDQDENEDTDKDDTDGDGVKEIDDTNNNDGVKEGIQGGRNVSVDGTIGSSNDLQKNGAVLPKTATNLYGILLIGGLLLALGGLLFTYNRVILRKRMDRNT